MQEHKESIGVSGPVRGNQDYHLFCVWDRASKFADKCEDMLAAQFSMVARATVVWSPELVQRNYNRLYGSNLGGSTGKEETAGRGPFELFIIQDETPAYSLKKANSGKIEFQNETVRRVKDSLRELTGQPDQFLIHSSNSSTEFWRDAHLLLGGEVLFALLNQPGYSKMLQTVADPPGSGGWRSLAHLVGFLNQTSEYVSLRPLAIDSWGQHLGGDLDLLVWDREDLAALANADPGSATDPSWQVWTNIAGQQVMLDLREVGDGDLCESWQRKLLETRHFNGQFFEPGLEDYFFYLLHHLATEKSLSRSKHLALIAELGSRLGIISPESQLSPAELASILCSWLRTRRYSISYHYGRVARLDRALLRALFPSDLDRSIENAQSQLKFLKSTSRSAQFERRKGWKRSPKLNRLGEILHHIRTRSNRKSRISTE